jgi:hypothetical protein
MDLSWTIENDSQVDLAEPPRPLLSTWHYLRSALRRRWRTVASLAAVGVLLGLGVWSPSSRRGAPPARRCSWPIQRASTGPTAERWT